MELDSQVKVEKYLIIVYAQLFLGVRAMVAEEAQLPAEERYVRCAEEYNLPGAGKFRIIICMFKTMSELLLDTKRVSIDTSFKRIHKWQEFEIEAWITKYSKCKCSHQLVPYIYIN